MNYSNRAQPCGCQPYACIDVAVVERRFVQKRHSQEHSAAKNNDLNEILHAGMVAEWPT